MGLKKAKYGWDLVFNTTYNLMKQKVHYLPSRPFPHMEDEKEPQKSKSCIHCQGYNNSSLLYLAIPNSSAV